MRHFNNLGKHCRPKEQNNHPVYRGQKERQTNGI